MESTPATVESQPKDKGKLLHILGVSFGIAGAIGGTIGAGILRTPGLVAAQLGSAKLIIAAWVAGGIYALLGKSPWQSSGQVCRKPVVGMFTRGGRSASIPDLLSAGWIGWVTAPDWRGWQSQ